MTDPGDLRYFPKQPGNTDGLLIAAERRAQSLSLTKSGSIEYWQALEEQRALQEQVKGNSSRAARCSFKFVSHKTGVALADKVIVFGIAFIQEPCVTVGTTFAPGEQLRFGVFPTATVGVFGWIMSKQGMYIGALPYAVVGLTGPVKKEVNQVTREGGYVLHHWLSFEGVAMKTMPQDVLDMLGSGQATSSGRV